jgi:hypothetical protein
MYQPNRPYFTACNVHERTERDGTPYLSGRNGSTMYVVTRRKNSLDGKGQWAILIAETPLTQQAECEFFADAVEEAGR